MNEELREALARWLYRNTGRNEDDLDALADEILALPEVAALLADAERVRRVRELLTPNERTRTIWRSTLAIREALDGDRP